MQGQATNAGTKAFIERSWIYVYHVNPPYRHKKKKKEYNRQLLMALEKSEKKKIHRDIELTFPVHSMKSILFFLNRKKRNIIVERLRKFSYDYDDTFFQPTRIFLRERSA